MFPINEPFLSSEIEYRRKRIAADFAASQRKRGARRWRRSRHPRVAG